MSTPIETVSAIQNPETITGEEVTCIFCGLPTPVPASGPSKFASHVPRHISIVRCKVCGKEAPYRSCDISEFAEMYRARGFDPYGWGSLTYRC
jgi:hypothetical protein